MSSADQIELEGTITEVFPGGNFKVETENGHANQQND